MEILSSVLIGQYVPGKTLIHRIDPRVKIVILIFMIIFLFFIKDITGYILLGIFIFFIIFLSGISLLFILKSLKPLFFLIIITFVINLFMTSGTVIWQWSFLKITKEGLDLSLEMSCRIILLITLSSLMTFTTSPIELTDGIEYLLRPLSFVGFPSYELAMMMSIALRFIPILLEETQKIIKAQLARGAQLDRGSLVARANSLIPIFVPLFISAFRRADELSIAMEARCYRGGQHRTRMKELRITGKDIWAVFVTLLFVITIVYLEYFSSYSGAKIIESLITLI